MPKYILDLNRPVLDTSDDPDAVDGLKPTPEKLSRVMATILKQDTAGDALKYLDWAIDLHRTGRITVDAADLDHLTDFVSNHKGVWALVRGQLRRALLQAKSSPVEG